jgi:hypothetical protein
MATKQPNGGGHGGLRAGAGRPPGARNKRTIALLDRVKKKGHELPLPRLLRRMNDKKLSEEYRDSLAAQAAPYCHARLSVVAAPQRPSAMADDELDRAIALAEEDLLRNGVGRDKWPKVVH